MVRNCSVKDCTADVKHKFKFPKASTDKKRLLKWLAASGNPSLLSFSTNQLRMKGICRLHFKPKYILAKKLSNTAVPTLHLPDAIDVSTYTIDDNNNNSESEPPEQQSSDNIKSPLFGDESGQQTILQYENKIPDDKVFDGAAEGVLVKGIFPAVDSSNDNTRYCRDGSNQQSMHLYENSSPDDTVLDGTAGNLPVEEIVITVQSSNDDTTYSQGESDQPTVIRYENRRQDDSAFDRAAGDSPTERIVSAIDFDIKQKSTDQNIQNANPSLAKENMNSTDLQVIAGHIMDKKTQPVVSMVQENERKKVNEICVLYEAFVKAGLKTHLVKLHKILEENSSEHTKNFIRNQLQTLITAIDNRMT